MDYDTYEVNIEVERYPVSLNMEIPRDYRDNEQKIYDFIMDSVMIEWDRIVD